MESKAAGHEVVVVGGRCGGAATAMLLARQGHDVVVVDRATFPSDTLSTHALARAGVCQLQRWGLLDDVMASGAPPIRQVTFHTPDGQVTRPVKDRAGVDFLVNPRRHVLDEILLDAAAAAGALVRTGVSVTGVRLDNRGRVDGVVGRNRSGDEVTIGARYVVGADGLRSHVARAVRSPIVEAHPASGAAHYAYFGGLDWEGIEFHVAERSFAGVFPTHDGEANVWVCTPAAETEAFTGGEAERAERFMALLGRTAPDLAHRLEPRMRTSPVRGAVGLANHIRCGIGAGWALVGDAACHRDPITGHGMTDAFRDAELLAGALGRALRNDGAEIVALTEYESQRRRWIRPVFDITLALLDYPPVAEFVELQKSLGRALDVEADFVASLPRLPTPVLTA